MLDVTINSTILVDIMSTTIRRYYSTIKYMCKDICKIFGKKLYKIRTGKGISQEELGFEVGLDKSTIGKYELARRCINIRTAKKIADALGVKLSEMLD